MEEFNYREYMEQFDIHSGDIVDVASDMFSLMLFCYENKLLFDQNRLIDHLYERVGEIGTLMIRMFNWDYCHGRDFDIRKTPGKVGVLGNTALKRGDFKRTRHPIYSWMVKGKHQKVLCEMENSHAFGEGTIFEFLYKNHAKQITLGNTESVAVTQTHHCEAIAKVPYRKEKYFTANYTDESGITSSRTYSMSVRPFNLDVSNNLDEEWYVKKLVEKGILQNNVYKGQLSCRTYKLREFTDVMVENLINGNGNLVVSINSKEGYKGQNIDWNHLIY